MAKRHTKILTVLSEHLDDLNHVNNVTFLKWVQDISEEHWNLASTPKMKKDFKWVVRNHNITYHHQALLGDEILLETHISENKGPLSVRIVKMVNNKTGLRLVSSETQWCLVDSKNLKPLRITDEIKQLF